MAAKQMSLQEKLSLLDKAANSINQKAGRAVVGRLAASEELMDRLKINFIPTPSQNINDAIGGGFARRKTTIVAGLPDSGYMLFKMCA